MPSNSLDQEHLAFLGQLAAGAGVSGDVKAFKRHPDWVSLERAQLIPAGAGDILSKLHTLRSEGRDAEFAANPAVGVALFAAVNLEADQHASQYAVAILCKLVRNNASRCDLLMDSIGESTNCFTPFVNLLERGVKGRAADDVAFLCTSLISRAPEGKFSDDQIAFLTQQLIKGNYNLTESGVLHTVCNILKLSSQREACWDMKGFKDLLIKNLSPQTAIPTLYPTVFAVWLFSFEKDFISRLVETGIIKMICEILKGCKTEKVIRLATRTLVNCMRNDKAVELVIEQNAIQVLTLLEYEKWRDLEMYDEIQNGITTLQTRVRQISNFDRYKNEVGAGQLAWSYLHSEKFWHENVMNFEDQEFEVVGQLVDLLKAPQSSPTTLAVACHDIGEFARLHPISKQVLGKTPVKGIVMTLMSTHADRRVCREALLCTQKMMLDHWQVAATEATPAEA